MHSDQYTIRRWKIVNAGERTLSAHELVIKTASRAALKIQSHARITKTKGTQEARHRGWQYCLVELIFFDTIDELHVSHAS